MGDLQQAQFALWIEPIAGLDLDCRATASHQRVKAASALIEQLLVRRGRGAFHGRRDAATRFRNLLVGRAGAAHRMLVGAGAAEDEMRVAVDQPRRDPRAAERDHVLGTEAGELGPFTDAEYLPV